MHLQRWIRFGSLYPRMLTNNSFRKSGKLIFTDVLQQAKWYCVAKTKVATKISSTLSWDIKVNAARTTPPWYIDDVKSNSHSMIPPLNYQWYIVAVKSKYPNHHDEITLTTTNFAVSAKVASNQMLQNRCRHFYDHNTATEAEKPYQTGNFKVVHCTTNQRQLLMKNLFWFLRQHFQPAFYLTIMWERHLSTTLKELVDKILTNFKIGRKKLKELEKINSKCCFHLLFFIPIILILCLAFCFASQIDFWLIG